MHLFSELASRATAYNLNILSEKEEQIVKALEVSGATNLVRALQMISLQKAFMAVGMFSMFEAVLQDRLECKDGFAGMKALLIDRKEEQLEEKFSIYLNAINVLKHGRGRSYEKLLEKIDELPFRIKSIPDGFFEEGDVAEANTLVEVDGHFVNSCANLIERLSAIIK